MAMNPTQQPSREEFYRVLNILESNDPLFSKVWSVGVPYWDDSIETACVTMVKDSRTGRKRIGFRFNPNFWSEMTDVQRAYVVSHEMLHIINGHLARAAEMDQKLGNIAIDVAVNDTLDKMFGMPHPFDVGDNHRGWTLEEFADTFGAGVSGQSAEEYYDIMMKSDKVQHIQLKMGCDEHGQGESQQDGDGLEKAIEDIAEKMKVSEEEIRKAIEKAASEELKKMERKLAGTEKGSGYVKFDYPSLPKRKWGDVIRKRLVRTVEKYIEHDEWLRKPRRFESFQQNILIPHIMETDIRKFDKLPVWLFQDTSGSCMGFAERFFKAAKSIPPQQFDVRMHCFDTQVYRTSLETGELFGFGGTSFSCIEEYIQHEIQEHSLPYPAAVFVVTDGQGDHVVPEHSDRWHWFLSEEYKEYIPPASPVFMLDTFED